MSQGQLHFLVRGKVQGVGFRAYVQSVAKDLNLVGWVRNLKDGCVEAVARGEAGALETLKSKLKQGPSYSRVDELKVQNFKEVIKVTEFNIERDGDTPCIEN